MNIYGFYGEHLNSQTKNGMDLVLDQMMGWTDDGAQTPFIPFSSPA